MQGYTVETVLRMKVRHFLGLLDEYHNVQNEKPGEHKTEVYQYELDALDRLKERYTHG